MNTTTFKVGDRVKYIGIADDKIYRITRITIDSVGDEMLSFDLDEYNLTNYVFSNLFHAKYYTLVEDQKPEMDLLQLAKEVCGRV